MPGKKFILCFCVSALSVVAIVIVCLVFRYDKARIGDVLVITDRFTGVQKLVDQHGNVAIRGEKGEIDGPELPPLIEGDLWVVPSIKWKDGFLMYRLDARIPIYIIDRSTTAPKRLHLELKDKDGFTVTKVTCYFNDFTSIDNANELKKKITPYYSSDDETYEQSRANRYFEDNTKKAKSIFERYGAYYVSYSERIQMEKSSFKSINKCLIDWNL